MKIIFTFLSFFVINATYCQDATLAWAKRVGNDNFDEGRSITIDNSGNVYVTGYFTGTVDFDPGPAVYNLSFLNGTCFILKLTAAGEMIWAKNMGEGSLTFGVYPNSIKVDAAGNVYTTGYFGSNGTADFDPGAGVYPLTCMGDDIFISKLDAAGNFVWARNMGGNAYEEGTSIAVDNAGNVYTTGYFEATADFDPGLGIYNLTSDGILGNEDIFISKLNSSGNFVWARNMGGSSDDDGISIAVDMLGNVYTTGLFNQSGDFDPGAAVYTLTTAGNTDIFLSKLDAAGNFVWAKSMGGSSDDIGISIALDANNNIYSTGVFSSTADFDPGVGIHNLISSGGYDIYVSKLDATGSFVWGKRMGGMFEDVAYSIAVDASGNAYTTGYFEGMADFDPGLSTYDLTAAGFSDIYINKLDASGNFVWAKAFRGTDYEVANSIALDISGNVYTTGSFADIVDFDPGSGIFNLSASGGFNDDIFIAKLSQTMVTASTWNGNVSNVWSDPGNWSGSTVPTITSHVVIPTGLARYPTVFTSTEIKSLTQQPGSSVIIAPGILLKINGN